MVSFVAVSGGRNSVAEPSGVQSGDVFLATTRAYYRALTAPAGWAQVGVTCSNSTVEYGTYYGQLWKTVRGPSAPSLSWGNIYTDIYWSISAYRNAAPELAASSGVDKSYVSPSLDNGFPDGFLVCTTSSYFDIASIPSGMTGAVVGVSRTGYAYQQLAATGATGTRTWAGDTPLGAWSVLLAPAKQPRPVNAGRTATDRASRW
jgi:hypothetical protein